MALGVWLITNSWLNWDAFERQHQLLGEAAQRAGLQLERVSNDSVAARLAQGAQLPAAAIVVDKDVRTLAALEARGVRLFNPARAIALCDDKALTHAALADAVPQPRTIAAPLSFRPLDRGQWRDSEFFRAVPQALGYPFVLKHAIGSWGQGVALVRDAESFLDQLVAAGTTPLIAQEFIASSAGRDVRLYMVGDEPVAAMQRFAEGGDFRTNLTGGGSAQPWEPTGQQVDIARRVMDIVGLEFAGVDFLFGAGDAPVICEVNSNAQFVGITQVTGADVAGAIVGHVAGALN